MRIFTEEHRQNISANHADMKGEKNPMYGKHLSEEARKKVSQTHKGKKLSLEHRQKMSEAHKKRWTDKSREEWGKKYTGKNNPNWRDGSSFANKSARNIEMTRRRYKVWRKNVFERDNYTCVTCGQLGGSLNADHIYPWSLYPDLRYELSNGRTLCVECHKKTETYWGHLKPKN